MVKRIVKQTRVLNGNSLAGQVRLFTELTKFEIVFLELITLALGYFIGHSLEYSVNWLQFGQTLFGVALLASGSGALNQFQEHLKDAQMDRTKGRPIPSGRIAPAKALSLSLALILAGAILLSMVSGLVLTLGLLAVISYNILYTLWWKPRWAFAAIPGAIPGALPILIGYQAATQSASILDIRGWYLFAILFFWQMPHFWVLALKYSGDYDRGGFPTLPVKLGVDITKEQITLWCLAYVGIGVLAGLFFPLGLIGVFGALVVSAWILLELKRYLDQSKDQSPSAKNPWLRFFLIINFSMIMYLGIILGDLILIHFHPRS